MKIPLRVRTLGFPPRRFGQKWLGIDVDGYTKIMRKGSSRKKPIHVDAIDSLGGMPDNYHDEGRICYPNPEFRFDLETASGERKSGKMYARDRISAKGILRDSFEEDNKAPIILSLENTADSDDSFPKFIGSTFNWRRWRDSDRSYNIGRSFIAGGLLAASGLASVSGYLIAKEIKGHKPKRAPIAIAHTEANPQSYTLTNPAIIQPQTRLVTNTQYELPASKPQIIQSNQTSTPRTPKLPKPQKQESKTNLVYQPPVQPQTKTPAPKPSRLEDTLKPITATRINSQPLIFYPNPKAISNSLPFSIKYETNDYDLVLIPGTDLATYSRPLKGFKATLTNTNLPPEAMPFISESGNNVCLTERYTKGKGFYLLRNKNNTNNFDFVEMDGARARSDNVGNAYLLPKGKHSPGMFEMRKR